MQLRGSVVSAAVAMAALSVTVSGFLPTAPRHAAAAAVREGETRLFISSWGRKKNKKVVPLDPEKSIQAYIVPPEPVAAKEQLVGTSVLVSGWVRDKERTDQFVFDLLNHEDNGAFDFTKIIAFVDDTKFAKKRLLSRSARYTGLLDKLDFVQASAPGALPTVEQLAGVKNWLAHVPDANLDLLKEIAGLAKQADSIDNVSVLVTQANHAASGVAPMLEALKAFEGGPTFSIVAVGDISEKAEGSVPYELLDLSNATATAALTEGIVLHNATFSRGESLRLVTECFALASASNKAFTFQEVYDVNQTEAKIIRGLREAGYTRPQEIDHMITKGPAAYLQACADFKTKKPDGPTSEGEWLAKMDAEAKKKDLEEREKREKERDDVKQKEIDDIAREWAKREYFRQSMSGDMPYSEEEYITSIWERALFEGDLKYRMLRGQETDERKELAEFQVKQAKKQEAMLEQARKNLHGIEDEPVPATLKSAKDDDK
eukprot:scaffold13731_cov51-Attheya_sp.AAC.3